MDRIKDPFLEIAGFNTSDAKKTQDEFACRLLLTEFTDTIQLIAGCDVAYIAAAKLALAAIVILEYPSLKPLEISRAHKITEIPYIPGFLSFREGPVVLDAFKKLQNQPQLIIFDGQGIAHPRGLGLASHMGISLNIPSVGCAKSKLVGNYTEPDSAKGSYTTLSYKNRQVGVVLRTRNNVKPVYISPGHLITIEDSMHWVLNCTTRYRLPEPTRLAHNTVSQYRKEIV
jgi:deoxyribonuclease V